jgi:hypothetical protein
MMTRSSWTVHAVENIVAQRAMRRVADLCQYFGGNAGDSFDVELANRGTSAFTHKGNCARPLFSVARETRYACA